MAAGQQFGVLMLGEQIDRLPHGGRTMECESVHDVTPMRLAAAWLFAARAQTACAVAGMAMSSEPMASVMALITAAGAAIAPASPQPLMPSGLDGHFVTVMSTLKAGKFSARGMV